MKTLGRSDRVDLPEFGLSDIHAKMDTGAYTSSIHCCDAKVVGNKLQFVLLDKEHPEYTGKKFTVTEFKQREIKNSFGKAELRYVINTQVKVHDHVIVGEFSLSDRNSLRFPVLLGRKILRNKFLIDVSEKDLSYKSKKKRL